MTFRWPQGTISSEIIRKALRQATLEQIHIAKSGHPGGSLSLIEIISSIYDGNFVHDVKNQNKEDRDRLVLSKGHGVPALYSVLSALGYFDVKELCGLRKQGHFLQGHPDKDKYPLMEASTGSLGQGVSVALGLALALRLNYMTKKIPRLPKVYCILGDGEMQEGQVWECLMAAGKFRPGNLIFILDRNQGQIDGPVNEVMSLDPLEEKIRAFNWDVITLDGHNVDQLKKTFTERKANPEAKALFVIANTVKGKGISFMENKNKWHGSAPSVEDLDKALTELFTGKERPFGSLVGSA